MFVLVGCARGAGPYVSIMRRWAICLYWLAVRVALGHMFVLVGCGPYVSIVRVYVYMCMCICMCACVCVCVFIVKELVGAIEVVQTSECSIILGLNVYIHYFSIYKGEVF